MLFLYLLSEFTRAGISCLGEFMFEPRMLKGGGVKGGKEFSPEALDSSTKTWLEPGMPRVGERWDLRMGSRSSSLIVDLGRKCLG